MAYDAIVAGLGAMGSAAAYQLAKRGARVLGIDRFAPPHTHGSSHGETRITRQAIGEGEEYVPLALRSYEIWREIEAETGADLLTVTGGLIMSSAGGAEAFQGLQGLHGSAKFIEQTFRCAQKFGIKHSRMNADEIRRRFPQFELAGHETGYYEDEAGFLRPENCIQAQLELAEKYGAEIRLNEKVLSFTAGKSGVEIVTEKGKYSAGKLVISAGPWVNDLLGEKYRELFKIYRQVLYWFELKKQAANYSPGKFPVFIWQFGRWADDFIYGFPAVGEGGLKLATEQHVVTTDPDEVNTEVSAEEIGKIYREYVAQRLPGLGPRCIKAVTCLYTATPDEDFVIDRHPQHENVLIASPCSGHGFKHSAAIGEILAELALEERTDFDLSKFSFERFQ